MNMPRRSVVPLDRDTGVMTLRVTVTMYRSVHSIRNTVSVEERNARVPYTVLEAKASETRGENFLI